MDRVKNIVVLESVEEGHTLTTPIQKRRFIVTGHFPYYERPLATIIDSGLKGNNTPD